MCLYLLIASILVNAKNDPHPGEGVGIIFGASVRALMLKGVGSYLVVKSRYDCTEPPSRAPRYWSAWKSMDPNGKCDVSLDSSSCLYLDMLYIPTRLSTALVDNMFLEE